MNAYDFDNTIFRGDSTARFLAFCARRYPRVWRHAPAILGAGALFEAGRERARLRKARPAGA